MSTAKKNETNERAVVICTAKRAVFFGYTTETGDAIFLRSTATIKRARMCTHWSAATRGVLGLGSIGPQKGSRIGPPVPELTCGEITAVYGCTPAAVEAWEAAPWT
jgi:hypothetical protein